jgi:Calpain family cysteine protease
MNKIKSTILNRAFIVYSKQSLEINEALNLIRLAQRSGLTVSEHKDLQTMATRVNNFTPGSFIFRKVVLGKIAQINYLIDKWFFGKIQPNADIAQYKAEYKPVNGILFKNGLSHSDINQGFAPNCSFLSVLVSLAEYKNSYVQNTILHKNLEGQNVYFVRFVKNYEHYWIAVDNQLPTYQGKSLFASDSKVLSEFNDQSELWVSLVEKAYNQFKGKSYAQNVTGTPESYYDLTGLTKLVRSTSDKSLFASTYNDDRGSLRGMVKNHAYAILSDRRTVYNPWGSNDPSTPYRALQGVQDAIEFYVG